MTTSRSALSLAAAMAFPLAACSPAGYGQSEIASASAMPAAATEPKAKNVILFIGDGMGVSTVTAARIYAGQKKGQRGEEYVLPFENFENVALVKTYNSNAQVPDSAGTASAMHTGVKTKIGVLGVGPDVTAGDCESGLANALPILGEQATARGLALGIVSTARITHATPASVYSRTPDRGWEADAWIPEDQRGKGCDDIAAQLVNSTFDVALGGGTAAFFGADSGGRRLNADANLPADWTARTGGTFVSTAAELAAAPADKPVLGLFSPSHMTYTVDRTDDSTEPTLTEMTQQAITRDHTPAALGQNITAVTWESISWLDGNQWLTIPIRESQLARIHTTETVENRQAIAEASRSGDRTILLDFLLFRSWLARDTWDGYWNESVPLIASAHQSTT